MKFVRLKELIRQHIDVAEQDIAKDLPQKEKTVVYCLRDAQRKAQQHTRTI